MLRIPLGELEEASQDPVAYITKLSTIQPPKEFGATYFSALKDSIFRFHDKGENIIVAQNYLMERLSKLGSRQRKQDTAQQFQWYIADYQGRNGKAFACRQTITIPLPDRLSIPLSSQGGVPLIISGQISRLDINIQSKGYSAWLFRSSGFNNWFNELRMPLIQIAVATKMGIQAEEMIVGIYSFDEKYADSRCYASKDISLAKEKLDALLAALGF